MVDPEGGVDCCWWANRCCSGVKLPPIHAPLESGIPPLALFEGVVGDENCLAIGA